MEMIMKKAHAVLLPRRVPALVPLTIQLPKETTYCATVLHTMQALWPQSAQPDRDMDP